MRLAGRWAFRAAIFLGSDGSNFQGTSPLVEARFAKLTRRACEELSLVDIEQITDGSCPGGAAL